MHLRRLERPDLETIRRLRNRDRHLFFDDREVSPDAQERWFESLPRKPVAFFVIEEDGQVVGTISVTTTAEGKEIGNLLLDMAYRGRGLMRRAVEQLTAEPGRYFSRVKPANLPSQRVFLASGFEADSVCLTKVVAPS